MPGARYLWLGSIAQGTPLTSARFFALTEQAQVAAEIHLSGALTLEHNGALEEGLPALTSRLETGGRIAPVPRDPDRTRRPLGRLAAGP